jgi:hypothetical protein
MVEGKGFGRRGSPSSGTSVLSPAQNRVARCIPRHPGPSLGEMRTPLRPIEAYALGAGRAEHPELLVNGVLEAILFARRGESRMSDRERVGPNRVSQSFSSAPSCSRCHSSWRSSGARSRGPNPSLPARTGSSSDVACCETWRRRSVSDIGHHAPAYANRWIVKPCLRPAALPAPEGRELSCCIVNDRRSTAESL